MGIHAVRAVGEGFRALGYQLDNETHPSGTADAHVQAAFRERLRKKFVTPEALNKAWGLNYWGKRVNSFDEVPPIEGALNPGYKLEWERFEQDIATEFLSWQATIVRELKRPDQFITHDFCGGLPTDVRQVEIVRAVDVPAVHAYFNFSAGKREFVYGRENGRDILTGVAIVRSQKVVLAPWDLIIVRSELSK
ncbi:MAG: beta-galactosidase [Candidatus Aminicenantes bacterium]|nr:beta-galactosidase [Candidatus Aminicenantes bacterium]